MGTRLNLQSLLESIIGNENVYFQPPPTIQMSYPCIVYQRSKISTIYADNLSYNNGNQYQLTVIEKNPDSIIPDKLAALPRCRHDRRYVTNNLIHDVFNIYF